MRLIAFALLLLTACQQKAPSAATSTPTSGPSPVKKASEPATGGWSTEQEACVDRALAGHGLDAYGSPQGTMYAGGTPLFDEATGQRTSRQSFLAQHYPDILRACGVSP